MLKKSIAGVLITFALAGTAYADCSEATSITRLADGSFEVKTAYGKFPVDVDPASASESDVQKLRFTAVRLKEKEQVTARAICQLEDGKKPSLLGTSFVAKAGKAIQTSGANWQGDDCATKDGDVKKCAFN
jgi:hypothetical protein